MVDAEELAKLEDKLVNGSGVPSDDDDDSDENEVSAFSEL